MNSKVVAIHSVGFCIFVLLSCTNPIEIEPYDTSGFAPLNVGDFRQFIVSPDSETSQFVIVKKTLRSDGRLVYQEKIESGTGLDSPITYYCYNDGQYLVSFDSLDTLHDTLGNKRVVDPYNESRYAMSNPIDGNNWFQDIGDTSILMVKTKYQGTVHTPIGLFADVFGFEFYPFSKDSLPFMTVCYAKNYGYLYTFMESKPDSFWNIPVYSRIAGVERGTRLLPKGPPAIPDTSFFSKRRLEVMRKRLCCFM